MNRIFDTYKFNITTVVFGSFVAIGVLPLVIIGYLETDASRSAMREAIFEKVTAISEKQSSAIGRYGRERMQNLDALSDMPFLMEIIERHAIRKDRSFLLTMTNRERSLIQKYNNIYGFHDILLINKKGDVIFSLAEEQDLGTNLIVGPFRNTALAEGYTNAMKLGLATASRYDYYEPSKKGAAFIVKSIVGSDGSHEFGTAIAAQLTDDEIKKVVNDYAGLGNTGETVLGRKVGNDIVYVASTRHGPESAFFRKVGEMGGAAAIPMQHAVLQEDGVGVSIDYRNKQVVAAWKYLPLWRLGMVVKIDMEEVFDPLIKYQYFVWALISVAILSIILLANFVSRLISTPIRELADISVRIADGDMGIKAVGQGITELSVLASSLNEMTENVTGMIQHRDAEIDNRLKAQEELADNLVSLGETRDELETKIENLNKSRKALFYMIGDVNRVSKGFFALNKELEAFSYSVSHDLRSPLRAMAGFSNALLEDYADKLDAQGKDFLNRICDASQRMGMLIDDMLSLSRITRQDMKYSHVDLGQMAKNIIDELKEQEPERQAELVVEEDLMVLGDEQLLGIALGNLMGNAWKFTAKEPSTKILLGKTHTKGKKTCFVRDNGVGFDMAYVNKLFGAFQRLHPSSEFEGTGIGLATVQRVIHKHGGTVWATGNVGEGATFFFTLG